MAAIQGMDRAFQPEIKKISKIAAKIFPRHTKYHLGTDAYHQIEHENNRLWGYLPKYNSDYVKKFSELTGKLDELKTEKFQHKNKMCNYAKYDGDHLKDIKDTKRKIKGTLDALRFRPEDKPITAEELKDIEKAENTKVDKTMKHFKTAKTVGAWTGGTIGAGGGAAAEIYLGLHSAGFSNFIGAVGATPTFGASPGVLAVVFCGPIIGAGVGAGAGVGIVEAVEKTVLAIA